MGLLPLSSWRVFDMRYRWLFLAWGTMFLGLGVASLWRSGEWNDLAVIMLALFYLTMASKVHEPPRKSRPSTWWGKFQADAIEP